MTKNTTIFIICTLLLCNTAFAQDIKSLLGIVPGEINVISIKNPNAPFIVIRMPTLSKELALFYPDLEVFISKETNRIAGVGSKRAYQSKIECKAALSRVTKLLNAIFPKKYTGKDYRWQFTTENSQITAGVVCLSKN